ncbi:hypothetical protein ACRALDRAFT_211035 [Sodiomyces alcalophilus JCM 7366]|uniref:uncharacterized protein n=1 Tax=Sodiomyces alcalophilus JCM 7366 TaxID=591952 RepID=UPI0039B69FC3
MLGEEALVQSQLLIQLIMAWPNKCEFGGVIHTVFSMTTSYQTPFGSLSRGQTLITTESNLPVNDACFAGSRVRSRQLVGKSRDGLTVSQSMGNEHGIRSYPPLLGASKYGIFVTNISRANSGVQGHSSYGAAESGMALVGRHAMVTLGKGASQSGTRFNQAVNGIAGSRASASIKHRAQGLVDSRSDHTLLCVACVRAEIEVSVEAPDGLSLWHEPKLKLLWDSAKLWSHQCTNILCNFDVDSYEPTVFWRNNREDNGCTTALRKRMQHNSDKRNLLVAFELDYERTKIIQEDHGSEIQQDKKIRFERMRFGIPNAGI